MAIMDLSIITATEDYTPPNFLYADDSHIIIPAGTYRQAGIRPVSKYVGGTTKRWNIVNDLTIDCGATFESGVTSGLLPNSELAAAGQPFNVWLLGTGSVLLTPILRASAVNVVSGDTVIALPQTQDGCSNTSTTKCTATLTANGTPPNPDTIATAGFADPAYKAFNGNLTDYGGGYVPTDFVIVYYFSAPKLINKIRWKALSGWSVFRTVDMQIPAVESPRYDHDEDWTTLTRLEPSAYPTVANDLWFDWMTWQGQSASQIRFRVRDSINTNGSINTSALSYVSEIEMVEDTRSMPELDANQLVGYRLIKTSCDSLNGSVLTLESNTSDTLAVNGDVTTTAITNDYFRLAPPATQPCLYLGTIIFDDSGDIVEFTKDDWFYTFPKGIRVEGHKSIGTPALTPMFKCIPPHMTFAQLTCLVGDSTPAGGFGIYLYDGDSDGVAIPAGLGMPGDAWSEAFGLADYFEQGGNNLTYLSWNTWIKMSSPSQIYNAFIAQRSATNAYPLYAWFLVKGIME
jgi:hypothetical protein